jgi:flagellar basal body-associated protein FliL
VNRRFDVVRDNPDEPHEPPRLRSDGVSAGSTWISIVIVLVLLVLVVVAVAVLVARYL